MHKNWTISCHKCGNNHATVQVKNAEEGYDKKYQFVVACPCGAIEDVVDIVSED